MKKLRPFVLVMLAMVKFSCLPLFLMILTVGLSTAKDGFAQELLNRPVSVTLKNQDLGTALAQIAKSANVKFSYEPVLITSKEKVSLVVHNEPLSEVLNRLLKPLGLTYDVSGKYIVLTQLLEQGQLEIKKNENQTLPR